MAGPIQTAIGQALGAVAGGLAIGKKISDDERQTAKKEADEAEKKAKADEATAKANQAEQLKKQKEQEKKDAAAKAEELKAQKEKEKKELVAKNEQLKAQKEQEKQEAAAKLEKKQKAEALREEKEEASAVATEADLIALGASPEAAEAYRIAQQRGTGSPNRIIFGQDGKPLATYSEMATILSDQSLSDLYSSRLRTKNAVKTRRDLLRNKSHKQNVREAVMAKGGKYGKE